MDIFQSVLVGATFLCTLVSGFLFAFAVVVMPGIRKLGDYQFIRAFQVIDGVIQDRQPLFILVWAGSVVLLIAAVVLGMQPLDGIGRMLLIVAALLYLLGVQLPTMMIHIPLNNVLQSLDIDVIEEATLHEARENFEPGWTRMNIIRTALSCMASLLLMLLLYRI